MLVVSATSGVTAMTARRDVAAAVICLVDPGMKSYGLGRLAEPIHAKPRRRGLMGGA
jgi:hypothetical protein